MPLFAKRELALDNRGQPISRDEINRNKPWGWWMAEKLSIGTTAISAGLSALTLSGAAIINKFMSGNGEATTIANIPINITGSGSADGNALLNSNADVNIPEIDATVNVEKSSTAFDVDFFGWRTFNIRYDDQKIPVSSDPINTAAYSLVNSDAEASYSGTLDLNAEVGLKLSLPSSDELLFFSTATGMVAILSGITASETSKRADNAAIRIIRDKRDKFLEGTAPEELEVQNRNSHVVNIRTERNSDGDIELESRDHNPSYINGILNKAPTAKYRRLEV